MKRAIYDKQFKMAVVKHAQNVAQSVKDAARGLGISGTNFEKALFRIYKENSSGFFSLKCFYKGRQPCGIVEWVQKARRLSASQL
ncbi:hypothetical protein SDC9_81854 [bioreactor metagenome]|uniref:Transposase n=1 Tax=bioreactor metagenome TaxID=1076179 RepID=A0A644ZBJ4_9ZZZZ